MLISLSLRCLESHRCGTHFGIDSCIPVTHLTSQQSDRPLPPYSHQSTQPSPVFQAKDYDHPNKTPCDNRCSTTSGCSASTSCFRLQLLSVTHLSNRVRKRGRNNTI